ncbi:unnamed protein product [Scytosiphon promiscuus]
MYSRMIWTLITLLASCLLASRCPILFPSFCIYLLVKKKSVHPSNSYTRLIFPTKLTVFDPVCHNGGHSFTGAGNGDDILILGNPALKKLGIDAYDGLGVCAGVKARITGIDTAVFRECHRVSVSIEALPHGHDFAPDESDGAVERLAERGPDIYDDDL